MPENLYLGRILVAALFLLPGFIFFTTVLRYCLPGGRPFGSKYLHFLFAAISSCLVFSAFDLFFSKSSLENLTVEAKYIPNIVVTTAKKIDQETLFKSVLNFIVKIESDDFCKEELKKELSLKPSRNQKKNEIKQKNYDVYENKFSLLIQAILLIVSPFSWILAALLSLLHFAIEYLMKAKLFSGIIFAHKLVGWIYDKIITRNIERYFLKIKDFCYLFILEFLASLDKKNSEKIISIYFYVYIFILRILRIVVIILLFSLVLGLILLILFLIPFEIFFFVYYKILYLFSPYGAKDLLSFMYRLAIPIIEVKNEEGLILKGRYIDMLSDSVGQIASLTITNVIQYSPNSIESKLMNPENRGVYVFPHSKSKLVIPMESIRDFNIWYCTSDFFHADFFINEKQQLETLSWYLDLVIKENKATFDFPKNWSFTVSVALAPQFCSRVLKVLEQNYYPSKNNLFEPFVYRRKLKNLLKSFYPICFDYLKEAKRHTLTIIPAIEKEILRNEISKTVKDIRMMSKRVKKK